MCDLHLSVYNAKFINEGSTKLYYGNDFVFVDSPMQIETEKKIQDIYCKEAAERGIENVQILSPFREKGEAASEQLNRAIRERGNPFRSAEEEVKIGSRTFRVHDRVMQTKNTEKVSNGDLGFITDITTGQCAGGGRGPAPVQRNQDAPALHGESGTVGKNHNQRNHSRRQLWY